MEESLFFCGACKKEGDAHTLMKCGVCFAARYCCVGCQKNDWSQHKGICTETAAKALVNAIDQKDIATVRKLVKINRVLNARVDKFKTNALGRFVILRKWTALHETVSQSSTDMMQILLEQDHCIIDIPDGDGESPLFVACEVSSSFDVIEMLVNAGADPNFQAPDGNDCLQVAVRAGYYKVCKLLLDNGADPHARDLAFAPKPLKIAYGVVSGRHLSRPAEESDESAKARFKQVYELLLQYE